MKNIYIKPRSEKHAYHIKKLFKWLTKRENEWKIRHIYFYRTHKVHIEVEDENHLLKTCNKKID